MEKKIAKKLYDSENNWIGMEITEQMTVEEAISRFPEIAKSMKETEYPL